MLRPRIALRLGRNLTNSPSVCQNCQHRAANLPSRYFSYAPILRRPAKEQPPPPPSQPSQAPQPPQKEDDEVFIPKPLGRPIGLSHPPMPGENANLPQQKKDYSGLTMKERHLAKRADLVEKWGTNYFRDFKNIRKYRSGKTFLANARIFKKEVAMYFPNFHGKTLEKNGADTTDVLRGKVSVVKVYSSAWGEAQVKTFTGTKENPEFVELLEKNPGVAQQVDINIEENSAKSLIVNMFAWRLRLMRKTEDWGKYFLVTQGVSQLMRESIGLLNGRVGYVYLLDGECKIRWAGSAVAEGTEKEDLNRGLKRLLEETNAPVTTKTNKTPEADKGDGPSKSGVDEKGLPVPSPVVFK